ncbi:MAG: hypothetical protein R2823_01025 [Acidimicrobiia bacterium]
MNERKRLAIGYAAILVGIIITIVASLGVHMSEAPEVDDFGRELYSFMPRGWVVVTMFQLIALGGVLIAMGGITYGFIYRRPMTWARAMLGGLLFTALMLILFAVIPNQFLTLTQSTLEWTPQKNFFTIPPILVLNNDVSISYAALKDMISAGYVTTLTIAVPVIMYQMQERAKRADVPKPTPVSDYGRPLRGAS